MKLTGWAAGGREYLELLAVIAAFVLETLSGHGRWEIAVISSKNRRSLKKNRLCFFLPFFIFW